MEKSVVISLIFIFIAVFFLTIFAVYLHNIEEPPPFEACHRDTEWKWDDKCTHIEEISPDPSLKSPKDLYPVLIDFSYREKLKLPPIYLPSWYRIRYVNTRTGGYSEFSSWSLSPVISGSCNLPCPDGVGKRCPFSDGYSSCSFNRPQIGIPASSLQYDPFKQDLNGDFIFTNLHRYVAKNYDDRDPPADDVEDEIVGVLLSDKTVAGKKYLSWIDVLDNPCEKGCKIPEFCQSGENECPTK